MDTRAHIPGAPASRDDPDDLIGQVIDSRYRVEALIGTGGMGNVYRAEHIGLRKSVALKRLHWSLSKVPEVMARFEREAVAVGRLDDPRCVRVTDFGKLPDESLYLVMELVDGGSLDELMTQAGPLGYRRALHIARHVLRGLAHAHAAGIVHRDIKPENILLTEHEGDPDFVKILDFGIAKLIGAAAEAGDPQLTQGLTSFGTPAYMSPEQVAGDPIDERTDLYSLSVVLYQALTGREPFIGEELLAVMQMHASAEVPPMAEVAPEVTVPAAIEAVVRRGLEKRRDDRPASAEAYLAELQAALLEAGEGKAAAPRRSRRLVRRAGAVAVLLVLVVAVAGAIYRYANRGPSEVARGAAELLGRGDPEAAIEYLESRRSAIDRDGSAQLQLGHAYAAIRQQADAVTAYRKALALGDGARDDADLRTNLTLMLDEKDAELVLGAVELLVRRLDDAAARERLIELASGSDLMALRTGARGLAEELGIDGTIDRTGSYVLDLQQAESCEARRPYVARLRALGDPAAMPALEEAVARKGNACLGEDASEAVDYLRSRSSAPPP